MAFVRLPQGMAYALLAGLPPQYGLYTELFGCLFYSLFATSRLGISKHIKSDVTKSEAVHGSLIKTELSWNQSNFSTSYWKCSSGMDN